MQNYKLTLGYDGKRYMGFDTKKDAVEKSIQGKLESILSKLYEVPVEVIGAVNTDAGVHAKANFATFFAPDERLGAQDIVAYIERYLPDDIVVYGIEAVEERHQPRFLAQDITYTYRLWKCDAPYRPLFERHEVNLMVQKLSVSKMKKACATFLGPQDFTPFTTVKKVKNPIKELTSLTVEETATEIVITLVANSYLLNMERLIVGTLVQVGLGQLPWNTATKAFETQKLAHVGHKVMAGALCLSSVGAKA
jgi:tRNA pseudouridine38-40 synthase